MNYAEKLREMYTLQDSFNSKVIINWRVSNADFFRGIWVECAEMMDNLQYKWWKRTKLDREAARMELVDIWHFIMCCDLKTGDDISDFSDEYFNDVAKGFEFDVVETPKDLEPLRLSIEMIARAALGKDITALFHAFTECMADSGLTFEDLYLFYVGKNALNQFREENGYRDGTYEKVWTGLEDNEHLNAITLAVAKGNYTDARTEILNRLSVAYNNRHAD